MGYKSNGSRFKDGVRRGGSLPSDKHASLGVRLSDWEMITSYAEKMGLSKIEVIHQMVMKFFLGGTDGRDD